MKFFIDGTIESISIATDKEEKTLMFSLLPDPVLLKTVTEGENGGTEIKKKAVFIKTGSPDFAHLRNVVKSENGKEVVRFTIPQQDDSSLKCLLLEAKNNRNTVRVFVCSRGGCFDVDFSNATAVWVL